MTDLALSIKALRTPPTDPDELEIASLLEEINTGHRQLGEFCGGCGEEWPCIDWREALRLEGVWIGRGLARHLARASVTIKRLPSLNIHDAQEMGADAARQRARREELTWEDFE